MYILYDFIFIIFAIVYLPYLIVTRRYHSRFVERLGIFDKGFFDALKDKEIIWLHAVSVGEVMAASGLIQEFHMHFPDHRLLISTVTKTGNSVASRIKGKEDLVIYFPLDLSFIIKKILNRLKVKLFVIMETEIWPNIITAFYKKQIPIILMNGRLSLRSFKAYSKARFLLKGVFRKISLFCMQTSADAARLEKLGLKHGRIRVTGNMKYDVAGVLLDVDGDRLRSSLGLGHDKKILTAGSTHRGEDELILEAYMRLSKKFPELILLIAPRHIERVDEIGRLITKCNLKWRRFSSLEKDAQIIILDVMGKLKGLYAISDIVFIGGSLLPRYRGHNPLEAAIFKKPILFGPHMSSFKDMAEEFLKEDAAIQIRDALELQRVCRELLTSPLKATEMGHKAFSVIERSKGATQKNLEYIKNIVAGV